MLQKTLRRLAVLASVGAVAAGFVVVPSGWRALETRLAADNPAALTALRLRDGLDEVAIRRGIAEALAGNDAELAASFVALADEQDITVDPAERMRVAAAAAGSPIETAKDFLHGFAVSDPDGLSAVAGTVAGDLTGYGDLRDLVREGAKAIRGEPADEIVMGLATVGLAVTGATWLSAGAALPARTGVSVVKAVRKTGHLSAPLTRFAAGLTREAVDGEAVRAAVSAAKRLDLVAARTAARGALRPQGMKALASFAEDAGTLYARLGFRGTRQSLALAENGDEVARLARLAAARGPSTRAVLKTLGRGAFALGGAAVSVALWSLTLAGYAVWLVWAAVGLGLWLVRRTWSVLRFLVRRFRRRARRPGAVPWSAVPTG